MRTTRLITWIAIVVIAHTGWMPSVAHAEEDAIAQYNLGVDYYNDKDYLQAAYWWKKAAEQGNANAQTTLALMYYDGTGVTQDGLQAAYWFKKAAEQGHKGAIKALKKEIKMR